MKISDVAGNVLRDIEFHGAPTIDKLFFPDQNVVIAQWSDKLFLISIDNSSVDSFASHSWRLADRPIRQGPGRPAQRCQPTYTPCLIFARLHLSMAHRLVCCVPLRKANSWPSIPALHQINSSSISGVSPPKARYPHHLAWRIDSRSTQFVRHNPIHGAKRECASLGYPFRQASFLVHCQR